MSALGWLAHRQLEKAVAEGHFESFEGKGEPLDPSLWGNPHEAEWELAYRMLRQADMAPRWIELDIEIRSRRQALRKWLSAEAATVDWSDGGLVVDRAEAEIEAINQLIEVRNFLAPTAVRPRFKLKLGHLLKN